ncbi:hypothetical protein RRF57_008712 [Xylaria bambusicola]|uniref:Uncharacterized protein n=1 Tax=Xylaria bambusicola TaxID=326684 RepID=A0AAN7UNI3_9PEZI
MGIPRSTIRAEYTLFVYLWFGDGNSRVVIDAADVEPVPIAIACDASRKTTVENKRDGEPFVDHLP